MPSYKDKLPDFALSYPDLEMQPAVDALNRMKSMIMRTITGDNTTIFVKYFLDKIVISGINPNTILDQTLRTFLVREEFDDYLKCVPFTYTAGDVLLHDVDVGTEDTPTPIQQSTMNKEEEIANQIAAAAEDNGGDVDDDEEDDLVDDDGNPTFIPGFIYVAKSRLLQRLPFDNNRPVRLRGIDVRYQYSDVEKGLRTASALGLPDERQVITPPYFVGDIITARFGTTGYVITDDPQVLGEGETKYFVRWEDINSGGRQWAVDAGTTP